MLPMKKTLYLFASFILGILATQIEELGTATISCDRTRDQILTRDLTGRSATEIPLNP